MDNRNRATAKDSKIETVLSKNRRGPPEAARTATRGDEALTGRQEGNKMQMSTTSKPLFSEPDTVYHANGAIAWGSGMAKIALQCPRSAQDHREGLIPPKETDAFAMGTAWDLLIADPAKPAWIVAPSCDRRSNAGKAEHAAAEARAEEMGIVVLSAKDAETLSRMWGRMYEDMRLELGASKHQFVARVEHEGAILQARIDNWFGPFVSEFCDRKTTRRLLDDFEREAIVMGYWFQIAWYRLVLKLAGLGDVPGYILASTKESPWASRKFYPDPKLMTYYDDQALLALDTIVHCTATNEWPISGPKYQQCHLQKWQQQKETD
jgi:hypothetical protein